MYENSIVVLLSNCDWLSARVSLCANDSAPVGEKDRMFGGSSMLAGIGPPQVIEVHDVVLRIAATN